MKASSSGPGISVDASILQARIESLGAIGANQATGGLTRFLYTEPWRRAKEHVAGWMSELGLSVREDAVGNLYGRLDGEQDGPVILTGSHVDTVIEGGRYDGALGVIASITAVEALKQTFGKPRLPIEVLVVCDEEGGRFHTNFWGAHAVTGGIVAADAERSVDDQGVTLAEAMRSAGYDPARIAEARRDDIGAWLELHIEQGRLLESSSTDLAVVTAIAGHILWQVEVTGREDHAGTAPMDLRHDPMAGTTEMINASIDETAALGPPAVCTAGQIKAHPGIANVVPERVVFSLDVRDETAARFGQLIEDMRDKFRQVAKARGLGLDIRELVRREPTPMNNELIALLSEAAQRLGHTVREMPSMAGHDSEVMARRWPAAMVFVPSRDGRSHTPVEFTPLPQIVPGVEVLAEALHALAYGNTSAAHGTGARSSKKYKDR
jgi:allantoate deiminase